MVIADLFVNIGIKGADNIFGSLKKIEDLLQGIFKIPTDFSLNLKDGDKTLGSIKGMENGLKSLDSQAVKTANTLHEMVQDTRNQSQTLGTVIPFPNKNIIPKPSESSPIASNYEDTKLPRIKKASTDTKRTLGEVMDIKGSDKTEKGLKNVGDGLKNVASMSLTAKAAIIAAMYAFQHYLAASGKAGTELTNYGALIGGSMQTLQQYQYAARQMGISNEETADTFKSLQSVMTKTKMGEGAPKGFAQVAMLTGGMTLRDVDKFMQNPELLLQRLQQYAQKEKRVGIRNETLRSFGLGDNMIAGLSRNAFRPEVLKKAPTYSDKAIAGLNSANIAWSNLGTSISMAFGHFNAAHGGQIIKDISILVNIGMKLADVFVRIVEKAKLFEGIEYIFHRIEDGVSSFIGVLYKLGDIVSAFATKNKVFEQLGGHFASMKNGVMQLVPFFMKMGDEFVKFIGNSKYIEHMTSMFFTLVEAIGKLGSVLAKVGAFVIDLGNKFKIFETIASFLDKFLSGFEFVLKTVSGFLDKIDALMSGSKTMDSLQKEATDFLGKLPGMFSGVVGGMFGSKPTEKIPEAAVEKAKEEAKPEGEKTASVNVPSTIDMKGAVNFEPKGFVYAPNLKLVTPNAPLMANASQSRWTPNISGAINKTVNINMDQDLHFPGGGAEPKKTADHVKKAVQDAFRQLPSQVQGS